MMHSESTFETATLPFLDRLYQIAFRMVHDQATAERLVERAYSDAQSSFHHLPEVTNYRAWMFSTLFRVLHRRRNAWLHVKGWWNGPAQPDLLETDNPGRGSGLDEMLRALDSIPGIFREVLLLADVEGFGLKEIQEILEIPADLASSRLAEARARLRAGLACGGPVDPPLLEDPALA